MCIYMDICVCVCVRVSVRLSVCVRSRADGVVGEVRDITNPTSLFVGFSSNGRAHCRSGYCGTT